MTTRKEIYRIIVAGIMPFIVLLLKWSAREQLFTNFVFHFFLEEVHIQKCNINDAEIVVDKLTAIITKGNNKNENKVGSDLEIMASLIGNDMTIDEDGDVIDVNFPE